MNVVLTLTVVALVALHQDNWFWDDRTLVFGFMPVGLLYHACLSLAAGVTWYVATRYCWPTHLDTPPPSPGRVPESQ